MPAPTGFDTFDLMSFITVFSFSFFASGHCLFMCGPIACATLEKNTKQTFIQVIFYNLGRMVSYPTMGFILGVIGSQLTHMLPLIGKILSIALGTLVILYAIVRALPVFSSKTPNQPGRFSLGSFWIRLLGKLPANGKSLGLGLITVFLPCMTLTPALATAASSASGIKGAFYMAAFAAGTLPAMVGAIYMPVALSRKIPAKLTHWGLVVFLFLTGIITIMRSFH